MSQSTWLRWVDRVVAAAVAAVSIVLAAMMLHLVVDSISRNVFNSPLPGTTEIVRYLWMPILAIVALGYAQLRDEHIRVIIITEKAPPRARRILEVAVEIVSALLALVLAIVVGQAFLDSLEIGKTSPAARWLPLWPGQLLIAVGFFICAAAAVARIYRLLRREVPLSEDEVLANAETGAAIAD